MILLLMLRTVCEYVQTVSVLCDFLCLWVSLITIFFCMKNSINEQYTRQTMICVNENKQKGQKKVVIRELK